MIKLGIIGTNWITQQFVGAIKSLKEYDLTAVYSRRVETAEEFASENGARDTFTDLNEFFNSDVFDTVYIASPNSLHFEQAKQAVESGKNVIVEKPAFSNQQQMAEFQEILSAHPEVKFFEAARNIHTANFHAIEKQINQMEEITGAEFTYSKYSSRYDKVLAGEEPNVFSLKYAGGALQDLGVYTVYDAVTLFGLPDEVAYFPTLVNTGVDGKGTAVLKYADFTVVLNFSKMSNSEMTSEVSGLKDFIEIDDAGELTEISYHDTEGKRTVIGNTNLDNPMIEEAVDFAKVLLAPDDAENQKLYRYWNQLSINVNKVLYNLRQDAHIVFVNE
ncbi:Gfo/Idh/MocA family protein [Lentilactobacillus sp. SPB1-3]|uniref:Gfo/Idh/MocA family protein n=1 Tax=Lentilactobacillus terminaliae TaxID=3003483 RepID=A0ACD5DG95_9LACO|nr:Gfo/Idh/MocA family oxidoreductase [Lentilactobacillus sp. SPB1-3]MCZ0976823.1 Gfo/Idh/MocA family oxidoreductase [Lentilactobacillus sp. SPB1-3]